MTRALLDRLMAVDAPIPDRAPVVALQELTIEEAEARLAHLVASVNRAARERGAAGKARPGLAPNRESARTVLPLAGGGRAAVYHASGAMRVSMGLGSMEHLFTGRPSKEALARDIETTAASLGLSDWIEPGEELGFETLWQLLARAARLDGSKHTKPVLCRAIGAYRHTVRGLPVLGAASVAVSVAGGSVLDRIDVQIRPTTPEIVAEPAILPLERIATTAIARLQVLFAGTKVDLDEIAVARPLQFGYIGLSKRKVQRVLAPAFVASFEIGGQYAQGVSFPIPATEEPFLMFAPGREAPPAVRQRPVPGEPRGRVDVVSEGT
jgi:hypothetical protein